MNLELIKSFKKELLKMKKQNLYTTQYQKRNFDLKMLNTIVLENVKTHEISELKTDGVFPYIGITPHVEMFLGQIKTDKAGFIITDETMQTSTKGVFAVGDVRTTPLRRVITAASDGAIGAVFAVKYLNNIDKQLFLCYA